MSEQASKNLCRWSRGMVRSTICRTLQARGNTKFVPRTHAELELTHQAAAQVFFAQENPDQVHLATAKVGGIHATTHTLLTSSIKT